MPKFFQVRFGHRIDFIKVLQNSAWLFGEKFLRIGIGIFVSVWVTRYLGPEDFGLLSYAVSFATIFGIIASLGLDGIVLKEVVKDPTNQLTVIGSAFLLKLTASILTFFLTFTAILLMQPDNPLIVALVTISAAGFLFQSINVIDFYFQATTNSKFSVIASSSALIIVSFLKVGMIIYRLPIITFAWIGLFEIFLNSLFLAIAYKFNHQNIKAWQINLTTIKKLLLDAWPLLLASIAVTLYMKIDVVMLQEMSGPKEVGIYAAATKLSEIWYLIPMVIASSLSPSLIKMHQNSPNLYIFRMKKIYFIGAWLSIFISIPFTFFASNIIDLFYGRDFIESAPVLAIHIWGSVAVFQGIFSSQHLLVNHLQKISLYRTCIGLISNILLNLILIPKMGALGAAISTVISYIFSVYALVLFKETESHGFLLIKSPFLWLWNK